MREGEGSRLGKAKAAGEGRGRQPGREGKGSRRREANAVAEGQVPRTGYREENVTVSEGTFREVDRIRA